MNLQNISSWYSRNGEEESTVVSPQLPEIHRGHVSNHFGSMKSAHELCLLNNVDLGQEYDIFTVKAKSSQNGDE